MVKPDKGIKDPKIQKQLLILGAMVFLLLIAGAYFAFVVFFSESNVGENVNVNIHKKPMNVQKKKLPENASANVVNQKQKDISQVKTDIQSQDKGKSEDLRDKNTKNQEENVKNQENNALSKDKTANKIDEGPATEKDKMLKDILNEAQNAAKDSNVSNTAVNDVDLLDQKPDKKVYKESVFQKGSSKYIVVSDENLNIMIMNAKKQMGRMDPFNDANKSDINKSINNINKMISDMVQGKKANQNIKPPVGINKLSDIIPPPPDLKTIKPGSKLGFNQIPNYSFVNPAQSLLDKTEVTGILGNAAVLNFNGVSRALQTGQNYKGIVVLSVSSNSVVLKASGVKVTKYLRD